VYYRSYSAPWQGSRSALRTLRTPIFRSGADVGRASEAGSAGGDGAVKILDAELYVPSGRYPRPADLRGAGGYLAISRRAVATTFVSSLQTIIDSIGPVDGLDWGIEGGDLYPAEAKRSRRPWRQCSRGPVRAGFDGAQ